MMVLEVLLRLEVLLLVLLGVVGVSAVGLLIVVG